MICQDLNAQLGLLPGDCIVAAGMVSYVWGTQQGPTQLVPCPQGHPQIVLIMWKFPPKTMVKWFTLGRSLVAG